MNKIPLFLGFVALVSACGPKVASAPSTPSGSSTTTVASAPKELEKLDVEPLRTKWTPAEITTGCAEIEKLTDDRLAKMVAIPDAQRTFADSFEAFEEITLDYSVVVSRITFMKSIHTDEKVREAGSECEERAGKYGVNLAARKDLYLAMKGYLANAGKADTLDAQKKRLVEITMRDFKRNGLELSDADRAKLISLRQRLAELSTKFSTNLGEDKSQFEVNESELEGLPKEFIAAHKKSKDNSKLGKVILTTKYPDYYPVMENAKRESTRKKMEVVFMNRGGAENLKLLNEAIAIRAQAAKILGYATHTDFVAEDRMAKDAKTINAFLDRMRTGLKPGLDAQTAKMQKIKAEETPNAKIQAWDWRYYQNQMKKRDYAIDDEDVRKYFPADKVMTGLFDVYARLFGLQFKEVPIAEPWADGVKFYEARDVPSGQLVARFYIDMYPRDGKYGHAAEFTISPGHEVQGPKPGYSIPLAALVLNFNPPEAGKPSFLSVNEVDTLFHEFGHVMHESLTVARYASQAGTSTARDFVEAPSQMLEHWVYQPEVLALLTRDPADPSKGMPADLVKKVIAARKYNAGVHYSRQLFLGAFDAKIHSVGTNDKVDADKIARDLWAGIMGYPEDPGAHFAGTFGHMMGGYDGGYYGYLWSEVFAADMFTRFQKDGVLNPKVGRQYRDLILARGRTVEPEVLLKDFLGREPSEEAFLRLIGIKKSS